MSAADTSRRPPADLAPRTDDPTPDLVSAASARRARLLAVATSAPALFLLFCTAAFALVARRLPYDDEWFELGLGRLDRDHFWAALRATGLFGAARSPWMNRLAFVGGAILGTLSGSIDLPFLVFDVVALLLLRRPRRPGDLTLASATLVLVAAIEIASPLRSQLLLRQGGVARIAASLASGWLVVALVLTVRGQSFVKGDLDALPPSSCRDIAQGGRPALLVAPYARSAALLARACPGDAPRSSSQSAACSSRRGASRPIPSSPSSGSWPARPTATASGSSAGIAQPADRRRP